MFQALQKGFAPVGYGFSGADLVGTYMVRIFDVRILGC